MKNACSETRTSCARVRVFVSSSTILGTRTRATRQAPAKYTCGAGEVMVVNLTNAYAPQLPSGLPDPTVPASARPVVSRAFHLAEDMAELTVLDSLAHTARLVEYPRLRPVLALHS